MGKRGDLSLIYGDFAKMDTKNEKKEEPSFFDKLELVDFRVRNLN